MQHGDRGGRGGVAVGRPGVQRPDSGQDAEAHVEGQEHPGLQPRIELAQLHLEERERRRVVRHVEGEDADQDEGGPEEQVEGQLHRGVFLGADAGAAEGPAEDALRAHLAARAPDADEQVHRQHRDLVEQEEHEQVERDEDAVDPGHQNQQQGVELLAAHLHGPGGPGPREDDDRGEQQHEQAHAVDAKLVVDAERRHQRHVLVELEAGRLPVVGHVDHEGEDQRHRGRGHGQPAHQQRVAPGQEHDQQGPDEGRPGDDGQHREAAQAERHRRAHRGQRIQTIRSSTPRATP